MSKYESKEALAAKIDWEGGVMESVEYGIKVTDLPVDTPAPICVAWLKLQEATEYIDAIYAWLEAE